MLKWVLSIAVLGGSVCFADDGLRGRATGIVDGDTLIVSVDGADCQVRLSSVDAPELDQPGGALAAQQLAALVLHKPVRIIPAQAEHLETEYPQGMVAQVWVQPLGCPACGMTLDVGLALLTTGAAWWLREGPGAQSEQARGQYEFAELEARAKQAGLWQDAEPVPPWAWRR